MIEVELTRGYKAKVCDCHYELIKPYKWSASVGKHQIRAVRGTEINKIKKTYLMHREIMDAPKNMEVDHIDHDTLNNQCSNLRLCTKSENAKNQKLRSDNTSGQKGVTWYKQTNRWSARIVHNKKQIHLGYFLQFEDAKKAYIEEAKKLFGEFYYKG